MTPADAMAAFIKRQAALYKVKEEVVREDLRKKFGTFNVSKIKEYQQYLYRLYKDKKPEKEPGEFVAKIGSEEEVKRFSDVVEQHMAPYQFHFPEKCPYHPNATVRGTIRFGKKAWICSEGGKRCQHRVRADENAARAGILINWDKFDQFLASGGGDIEGYKEWLKNSSEGSDG